MFIATFGNSFRSGNTFFIVYEIWRVTRTPPILTELGRKIWKKWKFWFFDFFGFCLDFFRPSSGGGLGLPRWHRSSCRALRGRFSVLRHHYPAPTHSIWPLGTRRNIVWECYNRLGWPYTLYIRIYRISPRCLHNLWFQTNRLHIWIVIMRDR